MENFDLNNVSEATTNNVQTKEESNMDSVLNNTAMVAVPQNNSTPQEATNNVQTEEECNMDDNILNNAGMVAVAQDNTTSQVATNNIRTQEDSNLDNILNNATMVAAAQNITTSQEATKAAGTVAANQNNNTTSQPEKKKRGSRPTNLENAQKFLQFKKLKDSEMGRAQIMKEMNITNKQYERLVLKYDGIKDDGDMICNLEKNNQKGISISSNQLAKLSTQPFLGMPDVDKLFAVPFGDGIIIMPDTPENRDRVSQMRNGKV